MKVVEQQSRDAAGLGVHARRGDNADPMALARLLDVHAVAEVLGVTVRHVRRLVAERRIPFLKWGHYIRFDPQEIARWLEQARVTEASRPIASETAARDGRSRNGRSASS